ncbi:hypothetical protein [Mycolicibacterium sp. S3B2]|uniref:hypothetical protein n=1 Tax=Mycolicibacterium sp. S3B2 TaxID=3415120 RepID=UPI003C7EC0C7
MFIVPSGPKSGHRTLKLVGLIHGEHAITKNLSVILQEAGYSASDVGKASSDAGIRLALFNGILKETNPQLGDAARLANNFAGQQAKMDAATLTLQQNLGAAIQRALLPFLKALTPIITKISEWVEQHQELAAAITIGVALFLALGAVIGSIAAVLALVGSTAALVFVGITAAVAAVVAAIITYWEPIAGFFTGIWGGIVNIVGTSLTWIADKSLWLKDHFWQVVGFIIGFFATLPIKLPL